MQNHMPYNQNLFHENTLKYAEDVGGFSHVRFAGKAKITPWNSNTDNCLILRRYYNKLYIFLFPIKRQFVWRWPISINYSMQKS